ncbi:MAG: hypothetical protein K5655_08880 [Lachnospiraceae bacterium]|nr:hypothetical protein [Lachnospiraceae bacterium]
MKKKITKWYMEKNEHDDVIVSCRVRLARNLSGYNFGRLLSNEDAGKLVDSVRSFKGEIEGREDKPYYSCALNNLGMREKQVLLETHAISPDIFTKEQPTGLILSEDESVSIMINGRDHIRIAAVTTGSNMKKVASVANRIDDMMDRRFKYAYGEKYGYLTSSLADVGTGLKASYMLFLPALTTGGKLSSIETELARFGLMIKGVYGDGNKSPGYLHRLFNRRTIGLTESDIYESLEVIVSQIVDLEKKTRREWYERNRSDIEDKVFRSYGVLKYARSLELKDAMTLLSQIELGRFLGIIEPASARFDIHRLMIEIQPAMLAASFTGEDTEIAMEKIRAAYIRKKLPKIITEKED